MQNYLYARHAFVRTGFFAVLVVSIFLFFWYVTPQLLGIASDISRNYNEGWMVTFARRISLGMPLYPEDGALIVNNYPPLWYFLLAFAEKIGLKPNLTGRIIEFSSFFACGAFVYLISREFLVSVKNSIAGAVFCLGAMTSWLPRYIGINDPHLFGEALMLGGTWLALRASSDNSFDRGGLFFAAFLCCIAGFVKHSLLPLPVSLCIFLYFVDRRAFLVFTAALVLFTFAGLTVCSVLWGWDFWHGILSDRTYENWRVRLHIERHLTYYIAMSVAVITSACCIRFNRKFIWLCLYVLLSVAVAAFYQLGAGVSGNHFYDSVIAFSLIFACCLPTLAGDYKRALFMQLAALAFLIGNFVDTWENSIDAMALRDVRNEAAQEMLKRLTDIDGRIGCEDAILCAEAGKLSEVDFFNIGQELSAGGMTRAEFLSALGRLNLRALQFSGYPGWSERFSPEDVKALLAMFPAEIASNQYYSVRGSELPTQ